MQNSGENFERLLGIMDELREKCPWDRKQTVESLRMLTIEEVYELADAIDTGNMQRLKEELGDIMLHLVFYAKIAAEQGEFNMADVLLALSDKLIARHPHIYGNVQVADENEVKANWEKLKLQEGKQSVLEGVPRALPALVKAYRLQEKAKQVGFDWKEGVQVQGKVDEEYREFLEAVQQGEADKIEEELGDLLFALVNYARFLQVDPEAALEKCNKKFIARFQYIEQRAREMSRPLTSMSLQEMDQYWNEAKSQ